MSATQMSTEDFVRQACPVIGNSGWAYYFADHTVAKGAELGLDGMQFYVAGRGGPLGDCDGAALASAGVLNAQARQDFLAGAQAIAAALAG